MKLERRSPFPLTPSNKNDYNTRTRIADERDVHKMTFGKIGSLQEFSNAGKFQLGHVAVWKRALSADEVQKVRAASVMRATRENFCCDMKGSKSKHFLISSTFFIRFNIRIGLQKKTEHFG